MKRLLLLAAVIMTVASCSLPSDTPQQSSSLQAAPPSPAKVYATNAQVLDAVAIAQQLTALPDAVAKMLSSKDEAGPKGYFGCRSVDNPADANPYGQCAYGDMAGKKKMVVYGDSRAAMWAATLEGVAAKNGYQLRAYSLGGCPVVDLQFQSNQTNSPNTNCDTYHAAAIKEIENLKPDLVFVTSVSNQKLVNGDLPTAEQWRDGWISTLTKLQATGAKLAMLGDMPVWENDDARCLAAHANEVQACAAPASAAVSKNLDAERAASAQVGAPYVETTPWVCADKCQPVIANQLVYNNRFHFTQTYAVYLTGALDEALKSLMG